MTSIISKILGLDGVVEKGLELIDDAWETDAEKTESKTKAKIELMKAYAPFRIAQRYLALLFGFTYLGTYVLIIILTAFDKETDKYLKIMSEFSIDWAMLTILAFYFGGGLADSVLKPKKGNGQ